MKPMLLHIACRSGKASGARGSSLVVVLIMLSVIFVIGVISARLSLFSERASRNDRDRQIAFQSAEAALLDAELDIMGPNTSGSQRVCTFDSLKPAVFVPGCGTGSKAGMCLSTTIEGESWKNVKAQYSSETGTATSNLTAQFGQFTGQSIAQGSGGLPTKPARYTIEAVRYAGTGNANDSVGNTKTEYAFLVTAMGFGLRPETQVLLQALIYKPANKPNAGCA